MLPACRQAGIQLSYGAKNFEVQSYLFFVKF